MATAATISAKLILDSSEFVSGINKSEKAADQFSKKMAAVGAKMQKVGAVMTAAVTVPMIAAVSALYESGKEFEGVRAGFENFTSSAGKSADEMLASMKTASNGMMSQKDIMLAYNNASGLVNEQFANKLPESMGLFAKVAAATGQDLNKVTADYVTGIGRQSKMILDNLGITVDLEAANAAYAASIGKTVSALTDEEKKLALNAQAMALLEQKYAGMSEAAALAGSSYQRFASAMKDLRDITGVFVVETLAPMLEKLAELANKVLPPLQKLLENVPMPLKMLILTFGVLLALAGPVIGFIGTIMQLAASMSTLGISFAGISAALASIWAALAPILLILALIAAAIFVVWYAWKNWDDIKLGAKAVGESWKKMFRDLTKWGKKAYADVTAASGQAMRNMSEHLEGWKAKISEGFAVFGARISSIWQGVTEGFSRAFNWIANTASKVFGAISNAIAKLVGYINQLKSSLLSLDVPDVLTPGSPTPFEIGLRGIGDAMKSLSGNAIPAMNTGLESAPTAITQTDGGNKNTYVDNRTFAGGMSAEELKVALNMRFDALAGEL